MSRLMTKPTKWHVHTANTQISLGIRPVWSESSLSAWRKLGSLATHWAHSKDSDQTGWMPRLIWVFAGCTGHFIGFVMMQLIYLFKECSYWQPKVHSQRILFSISKYTKHDKNIYLIYYFLIFIADIVSYYNLENPNSFPKSQTWKCTPNF